MNRPRHNPTFAERQGITVHVSPLRHMLERVRRTAPAGSSSLEEWMLAVANHRGATVIRGPLVVDGGKLPGPDSLQDEQLIIGLLLPGLADLPQMLRPAAQLISRGDVRIGRLLRLATMERADRTLAELARQALTVDPEHPTWSAIADAFSHCPPYREPVLHWTRLANPIMRQGRVNAESWRLAS